MANLVIGLAASFIAFGQADSIWLHAAVDTDPFIPAKGCLRVQNGGSIIVLVDTLITVRSPACCPRAEYEQCRAKRPYQAKGPGV
jgi:hypothetical protein